MSKALPKIFYGDPAESVDEIRAMRAKANRAVVRSRQHKHLRIQALVQNVLKNGGSKNGKR